MTQRLHIAAGTLLFAAGLLGCEDAGKKPVQARVPALAPAATPQAQAELALLPVVNPPHRYYVWLLPAVPGGKGYLVAQGRGKFAPGASNLKGGPLEAQRKDSDDDVDARWQRG